MIATTLNDILKHNPCNQNGAPKDGGWQKLMAYLGKTEPDDEPLPLAVILKSNGLDDALWSLRCLGPENESWIRFMICDMVEPALQYTDDDRVHEAVRTARRFARGECDAGELAAARAALDASRATELAELAELVARATRAALDASRATELAELAELVARAVRVAALAAARNAARAARNAALAARAAWVDARAEQEAIFLQYVGSVKNE